MLLSGPVVLAELSMCVWLLLSLPLPFPCSFAAPVGDEGSPMQQILSEAVARGMMPGYVTQLLVVFEAEMQKHNGSIPFYDQSLVEPLSQRELGVLHLIVDGFSNREIGEQLFLALDTVKGHNRRFMVDWTFKGARKPSPARVNSVCCRLSFFNFSAQDPKTTPPTTLKCLYANTAGTLC